MKQGHWITIDKYFKNYKRNIKLLKNFSYPYISGVDYSKANVVNDNSKNVSEQIVFTYIYKKEEIEKQINFVNEVIRWFEVEGYGRERYIKCRYLKGETNLKACDDIGISERTGKNWKRDIFLKAETIAENLGIFTKN